MFGLYVLHQEESETISLSSRRRRTASLRPALPPVQTAVPSLSGPAFNFVAFANMVRVLFPTSLQPSPASLREAWPAPEPETRGDQGEEKADPSHLLEKQQEKGWGTEKVQSGQTKRGGTVRNRGSSAWVLGPSGEAINVYNSDSPVHFPNYLLIPQSQLTSHSLSS